MGAEFPAHGSVWQGQEDFLYLGGDFSIETAGKKVGQDEESRKALSLEAAGVRASRLGLPLPPQLEHTVLPS